MFEVGQSYKRRKLHELYGGQQQGGISTPTNHRMIFIFTGPSGGLYGYRDGWKGDTFHYTGEGQLGEMDFIRGNRAIRDHLQEDKQIHLFESEQQGYVKYICQLKYLGHTIQDGIDRDSQPRKIIVFQLQRM